jgi:hypothetical protein
VTSEEQFPMAADVRAMSSAQTVHGPRVTVDTRGGVTVDSANIVEADILTADGGVRVGDAGIPPRRAASDPAPARLPPHAGIGRGRTRVVRGSPVDVGCRCLTSGASEAFLRQLCWARGTRRCASVWTPLPRLTSVPGPHVPARSAVDPAERDRPECCSPLSAPSGGRA